MLKGKAKKPFPAVIIGAVIIALVMVAASSLAAAAGGGILETVTDDASLHEKPDISQITGEIAEPPELTSAASVLASEKEWYEYIYYSPEPVSHYYIDDHTRLSFFDPYDYASSLIMEVEDCITDWASNNSLQISYTTGNSMSSTEGKSAESSSSVQVAEGNDLTETKLDDSIVQTTVEGRINTYNDSKSAEIGAGTSVEAGTSWSLSETFSSEAGLEVGASAGVEGIASASTVASTKTGLDITNTNSITASASISASVSSGTSSSQGYTEDNTTTTSVSSGGHSVVTSTIADRITKATGSSVNSSISMSTDNSTTITKTYDAGYFNANGAPLQWKIIKYTVKMPMKYQVEYLVDGEWIYGDSSYCVLNTVQGTCRAWLQNNTAYYEHWGTGEPVTWDEFWGSFFTKESLIAAYQNKLYPTD